MRRIKSNNINTSEYWDKFATEDYTKKDEVRGGSICKFNTIFDLLPDAADILDIGCLNGNLYNSLTKRGLEIHSFTGVDISKNLTDLATKRFPDAHWIQADCEKLPFENKVFDVVTILEMLEHINNPLIAIKEAARVCKDGGMIIISVPNELKIEDPSHIWSFTTEDVFNLLSTVSTNVQVLQTCSNNRNIVGKAIINFKSYF